MFSFLFVAALNLLGVLGLVYALVFENGKDPRFEGDKLIYRS